MPHLLIAGSTGSGKSILLHSIIHSLTKQMTPDSMRLILIDPKRVELASFKKVPHLDGNVIYEYEDALMALLSLTDEMERRYKLLEDVEKRNIEEYNKGRRKGSRLPYMVVVFDEFADFMIRSNIEEQKGKQKAYSSHSREWLLKEIKKRTKKDFYGDTKASMIEILEELDSKDELRRKDANVELLIVRLAQMARAVGIHLIIATQSPRVDVITGMIKANIPAKIALTTANSTESTIILGQTGAEKLSGKGDMLFLDPSSRGIQRLQGYIVK
jgi:S-DNA-T family DNA segregation ATPase FtsK/SpoIIIE